MFTGRSKLKLVNWVAITEFLSADSDRISGKAGNHILSGNAGDNQL
ncbi:MAG: hypothetical protein ACFB0E_20930 [Leptolyngbyaceae cyanobacterium]